MRNYILPRLCVCDVGCNEMFVVKTQSPNNFLSESCCSLVDCAHHYLALSEYKVRLLNGNFSAAGLTVDKLRSRISPKNVDDLLFLRSNIDLV